MKKEKDVVLSRVEEVTKEYDSSGKVVKEIWKYYYPEDEEMRVVGFKEKKK